MAVVIRLSRTGKKGPEGPERARKAVQGYLQLGPLYAQADAGQEGILLPGGGG